MTSTVEPQSGTVEQAEARADAFVAELSEWLRIPSISADPGHHGDVARSAEWIDREPPTTPIPLRGRARTTGQLPPPLPMQSRGEAVDARGPRRRRHVPDDAVPPLRRRHACPGPVSEHGAAAELAWRWSRERCMTVLPAATSHRRTIRTGRARSRARPPTSCSRQSRPPPPRRCAVHAPDLDTLRLRALTVPGVTRLADHHDGTAPPPHPTSHSALRVFDHHVEIDIFLAAGHAVTTTATAVRAALAPLLTGHDIHVTVIDVDTTDRHPDPGGQDHDPVSPGADEALRGARGVARAALADPESVVVEGLPVSKRRALTGICRILVAYDVDSASRRVLLRRLRHLLTAAHGPHAQSLVDRLDALDDTDKGH